MPVICTFRAPGVTPEKYDQIREYLAWEPDPPSGGMAHYMSFAGADAIEVDVWESREGFLDFYRNHLEPACERFGVDLERPEIREIYLMAHAQLDREHSVPRPVTRTRQYA